jgi:hypothetical protein
LKSASAPCEKLKLKPECHQQQDAEKHYRIPFLEDWVGVKVTVYVDKNVRFGKESVEGLRLSPARVTKPVLSPEKTQAWNNAKAAFKRDGNLDAVLARMDISPEHRRQLEQECSS